MGMDALSDWKLQRERIDRGEYKIGDISFQRCNFCFHDNCYTPECIYSVIDGYIGWACGFCQRKLNIRSKDLVYKIAIDADSLVNIALSRQPDDLEAQYFEFCAEIGKIKGAPFAGLHDYEKGDSVEFKILLTPNRNFRYDVFPEYKANRPPRSEARKTLMKLILNRLKPWVELRANVEADDLAIYFAKQGWMVAAIDKDVINACPTYCYNYKNYTWEPPSTPFQIENWYLLQCLMGDSTDGIPGAPGIGKTGAINIMHGEDPKKKGLNLPISGFNMGIGFYDIIQWFDSPMDAITSMRLVRMDQYDGEKVVLWEPSTNQDLI